MFTYRGCYLILLVQKNSQIRATKFELVVKTLDFEGIVNYADFYLKVADLNPRVVSQFELFDKSKIFAERVVNPIFLHY